MPTPDDPGILAQIGIRVSSFFAGTAGGLVGVFFDDKASLKLWFTYAFGGGLVANYVGLDARHFAPSWMSELGMGFCLGVMAPVVVVGIKSVGSMIVAKWSKT